MKTKPIIIDLGESADMFCGAGGTSTGLIDAVGQRAAETNKAHHITLTAINHWQIAIETHKLNHPTVRHIQDDLERIQARDVIPGGDLRLLVASPECVHFSNARGGEPMNWQSRATSKYVVRWASQINIEDILLENVREFMSWGPLYRNHPDPAKNGRPIPSRKGQFFRAFVRKLESLGYTVDHRLLCAADFGDPTSRVRFFLTITGADTWNFANPVIVPVNHGKADARSHSVQNPFPSLTSVDAWSVAQPVASSPLADIECPLPTELPDEFGPFKPFLFRHQGSFVLLILTRDGVAMLDVRFRMIKPPELARAHSLDNYTFVGSREQVVKQIGNSVPKRLAQALCYSALFN